MAQIIDTIKGFINKVGLEVLAETIAEELRGLAKGTAQDATRTIKARWLGLGLADEAAFNHELAVLGPTGTRIIIAFLDAAKDKKKTNLFRLIVTSMDTSEQRQEMLRNICDMNNNDERRVYFEQTIAKQEYLEQAARWLLKNAGTLSKQVPEFARWLLGIMEREYRRLENVYDALDIPEGTARAAAFRATQVAAMRQKSQSLLVCRLMRRIFR